MSITPNNIYFLTSNAQDLSGEIFSSLINVILSSGSVITSATLPISQPVFTVVSVQNLNATTPNLTVTIGLTPYVIMGGQELTIYYYGLPNITPAYTVYYGTKAPPALTSFAATLVTPDPITFIPTFTPPIPALSYWAGGVTDAGETPIQSANPINAVFTSPVAVVGKTTVVNQNLMDPEHIQVDVADAVTETNYAGSFWLLVSFSS